MKTERTMNRDRAQVRPVIVAAAVASFFMLAFGAGYRLLAARLNGPVDAKPVAQETLDELPMHIGAWVGQDTPLPPEIIEATDTDAHVSRRYVKDNGREAVSLWIASGVQARDLMPHRPEVCYLGNGYTLVRQRDEKLTLSSGVTLPCNVMEFSRGMLNTEKVLVLYYYLVDGAYCQSVAQWRYQTFRRVGYVTQVQVVAPIGDSLGVDAAQDMACEFATDSALPILKLFDDVATHRSPQ
ncbi:MAG: EpsI family protein [Phycisphaerales bacterium]|nr:MAG: EpsI family protein [Phycisphaerales bacterium]